jgi:hypothetical protein
MMVKVNKAFMWAYALDCAMWLIVGLVLGYFLGAGQ